MAVSRHRVACLKSKDHTLNFGLIASAKSANRVQNAHVLYALKTRHKNSFDSLDFRSEIRMI